MTDTTRRDFLGFLASALVGPALPVPVRAALQMAAPIGGVPAAFYLIHNKPLVQAHLSAFAGMEAEGNIAMATIELAREMKAANFDANAFYAFLKGAHSEAAFKFVDQLGWNLQPFAKHGWGEIMDAEGQKSLMKALLSAAPDQSNPSLRERFLAEFGQYVDVLKGVAGVAGSRAHPESLVEATLQAMANSKLNFVLSLLEKPNSASMLHTDPMYLRTTLQGESRLHSHVDYHKAMKQLDVCVGRWRDARNGSDNGKNDAPIGEGDAFEQSLYKALRNAHEPYEHGLLADIHVPEEVRAELHEAGFDVRHTFEMLPPHASDTAILNQATATMRTVISQDQDFVDFGKHPLWRHHGAIVLPQGEEALAAAVQDIALNAPRIPCAWIGRAQQYGEDGVLEVYALRPGGKGEAQKYIVEQRRYTPELK